MQFKPMPCIHIAANQTVDTVAQLQQTQTDTRCESIQQALDTHALTDDVAPCFYIYKYEEDDSAFLGLIGAINQEDYDCFVSCDNTQQYISVPCAFSYETNSALDIILASAALAQPLMTLPVSDTARCHIWRIARKTAQEALEQIFVQMETPHIIQAQNVCSQNAYVPAVAIAQENIAYADKLISALSCALIYRA